MYILLLNENYGRLKTKQSCRFVRASAISGISKANGMPIAVRRLEVLVYLLITGR
jgi:hypothetical protein